MDPGQLEREALAAVAAASSTDEIEAVRVEYLGRKSALKLALREVRDRETGIALNAVRVALEEAIDSRTAQLARAELDRRLREETVDVTLRAGDGSRGHLHLITQIRREVEDVFLGLGYEVYDGREVDTVWHNFTALNTPQGHPSRSHRDTFYVADDIVLRTHTSNAQIRVMEQGQPPVYIVSLGRCYRRDTADATHNPIFHQVECLAVDRGITLADLKGTIERFSSAIFGPGRRVRMRTGYFPFTEPSVEFDVSCFLCERAGCTVCKHSGWIEMGGAGVVDPDVFVAVGWDPEEWSGFAFGLGLERIAMLRHGLPDLRLLWNGDLRVMEQFPS